MIVVGRTDTRLSIRQLTRFYILCLALLFLSSNIAFAEQPQTLRVFAAQSVMNTGVINELLDAFHARHPAIEIQLTGKGALEVLNQGRLGNADYVITHHPPAEEQFVSAGFGAAHNQLIYSEYVLVGPADKLPGLKTANTINQALSLIAQAEIPFLVPAARSGTFRKIEELWAMAGIETNWLGYESTGSSATATLRQAASMGAFTIVEMATYLVQRNTLPSTYVIQYRGDIALRNIYSGIVVNSKSVSGVNQKLAQLLHDFLISDEAQDLVRKIGEDRFHATFIVPAASLDPRLHIQRQQQQLEQQHQRLFLVKIISTISVLTIILALAVYIYMRRLRLKRRELEIANQRYLADLEQAAHKEELKNQFLAKMNHELRTPLTAIIGFSDLLKEKARRHGHNDYMHDLDVVHNSAYQLLDLMNDILDIAKIESNSLQLHTSEVEVRELVNKVVDSAVQRNKNNLPFLVEYDENIKTATLDIRRTHQVLINLLDNAFKFTPTGRVSLIVQPDSSPGSLLFIVEDTGIGIDKDKQKKIFTAFEHADSDIANNYGGTGLGLTISKRLAELMAGELTMESETGKGTRFYFRLPCKLNQQIN